VAKPVKRVRSPASKLGMEAAPGPSSPPSPAAPGSFVPRVSLEREGVEAGLTLEYLRVEPRVVVVAAIRATRARAAMQPTMVPVAVAGRRRRPRAPTNQEETVFKELYLSRNKEE
jgi:hypothetical protein